MLYPSSIPYMKTVQKKVVLDKGTPPKKGNLVFLFAKTYNESLDMIVQKTNLYPNKSMYYYFYNPRYIGYIGRKRYNLRYMQTRDTIYDQVSKMEEVRPYPKKLTIMSNEQRSTYFDLSTYVTLFNQYTGKLSVGRKIEIFWKVFRPILEDAYGKLKNKVVLINASNFPLYMQGSIKDRAKNPLYLFYLTLYKHIDLVMSLDIDFLVYAGPRVLRFNFSKCDKKSFTKFFVEMRRLYKTAEIPRATEEEITIDAETSKEEDRKDQELEVSVMYFMDGPRGQNAVGSFSRNIKKKKISPAKLMVRNLSNADNAELAGAILSSMKKKSGDDESFDDDISQDVKNDTEEEEPEVEKEDEEEETTEDEISVDDVTDDEADEIEEKLEENPALMQQIYDTLTEGTTPHSQRSTARDEMLRKEQSKIQVRNTTISDLAKINPKERKIPETDVSKVTHSSNPNIKKVKFNNFNKAYVEEVMTKDIVGVFENLNDRSIKMFILDIDVKDSSSVTDLKETWTVHLEDELRGRHTIKFDIPKFYDKNFMWLGGNVKNIKNQLFFLPVVKISADTVMVVTNYNKMTVTRVGGRSLVDTTLMNKLVSKHEELGDYFKIGSCTSDNLSYITTLEYDEYAKFYTKFKVGKTTIWFAQKDALAEAEKRQLKIPEKKLFIGINDGKPIYLDIDAQVTDDNLTITDLILDAAPVDYKKRFASLQMHTPKRVMHTSVTTMKQSIPMVILLSIWEGFTTVVEKAHVEYRLAEKIKAADLARNEDFIKFKDCVFIYKKTIPVELLMSGFRAIRTEDWNMIDMNTQTPYIPYVEKKYGKISILNALNNVYEFTIGNIEREILRDMKLPTDLVELMVYANSLLADSQYISENNLSEYRIRSAEIIPAILYDCIAKAYVPFKNSNGKKKLSIPQDVVIKKLLALETVEDTSSINPFLELETTHGVSTKGWRGVNLDDSYTVPKRCYDDSMRGVIGLSSPPDANVGIARCLTMEPNINSLRGYIDVTENLDELKDVNLFSPAELLIPLGATRDDPIRTGHSVKQSRASVPVRDSSPVLMSNGSDESCAHYLSSDYVVEAEQDGVVIEYDEKSEIMIVEYKDGTHRAINLGKKIVKNGGGGFELENTLVTDLKVGDKVKKNSIIAWHKNFFKKIPGQGVRMCVGALAKVALYSLYNTYEDGTFISENLAGKCETEMVFRIKGTIGRNANIFNMVKVGDEISVGQPLMEYDESFDEADINALLASLGDDEELRDAVVSNNRNSLKSDKSGIITEIKIYSAAELDELSPSLRRIVKDYYNKIDRKNKLLNKYDNSEGIVKCGVMITESSGTTKPNKYGVIRGEKVGEDGVLFEFSLKHAEPLEVGSKLANFSPLKNVVGEVVPAGFEPKSELRPDEIVDTVISPSSILARMVGSVYITIFGNKVIIELKRKLYDIYVGPGEFSTKKGRMKNVIYKTFDALDPTKQNTKKYKEMFDPMSDAQWKSFFKEFFENEYHYLILEMVDYEREVTIENIEAAAKVLGVPLYEYVTFYHLNMDSDDPDVAPIVTPYKVPVGYIIIKRPQQTVMKKNGMSTGTTRRAGITNQVTGKDKNGRESDLENCMLSAMGLKKTLKELNGARADDSVAEKEMLQAIAEKGYFMTSDLTDDVANKATLNAVNTYFLGMGLQTDLVTKGLKLASEIDQE